MKSSNHMKSKRYVSFAEKKIKEEDLDNKKYSKVRDHCHYIGKYRRATHSSSNLRHSIPKEIPVLF